MRIGILIALSLVLTACGGTSEDQSRDKISLGSPVSDELAADDGAAREEGSVPFDIDKIAVSNAALGAFPYFSLPDGYTNERRGKFTKDFARFPFWVEGKPVWVEGKFYGTSFTPVRGKEMSQFEVKKNFESVISQLGGVQLSEEKIPSDTIRSWGDEITSGFLDGLGDVYNAPATTYVIRRDDGNIWVHLVTNSAQGWYIVGREQGFEQTASILSADALKEAIDRDGKATVQVNFATDASEILPASKPQIDAIATMLKEQPNLRLAVNGHTDNTGNAGHNQRLSEQRAASVKLALVALGVEAGRLTSKGFGSTEPVADNGSEEGKARNRRVELVRL